MFNYHWNIQNLEKKEEESQGDQKKAAEGKGEDSGTDEEDIVYSEEEEVEVRNMRWEVFKSSRFTL